MTPEAKGRFCASCQKTVIDFTDSSDREIASILKNQKSACGRFREGQLNRNLILHAEKSSVWLAASAAVFSFMTIGNDVVSAQTPANLEQTDLKTNHIIGDTIVSNERKLITGIVSDENNSPLPGVQISIKNTSTGIQTYEHGRYMLLARYGDEIIFSYIGHNTVTLNLRNNTDVNVQMDNTGIELKGDIVIIKKRTFFGRIFRSIGNLFR